MDLLVATWQSFQSRHPCRRSAPRSSAASIY